MPESVVDQFSQVVAFQNLLLAFRKAARGKRGKAEIADFEFNFVVFV